MLLVGVIMAIFAGLVTAGATVFMGHGLMLALLSYSAMGSVVLLGWLCSCALLAANNDLHVA
ncbi:MAG: hypothetical protein JJT99_01645 [Rhodobacteraceae bacterium]|nr:hypothetical protein [Paracoccaceae bacterium]